MIIIWFISNTSKVNQLYDRFDFTSIIELSEGDNLARNDGFLMFWVWSISSPKVRSYTTYYQWLKFISTNQIIVKRAFVVTSTQNHWIIPFNHIEIFFLILFFYSILLNQLCMTYLFTKRKHSLIFSALKRCTFIKSMLLLNFRFNDI